MDTLMTRKELELAAMLLKRAANEFSNHGCNDLKLPDNWTQAECDEFLHALQAWNGDPENYRPGQRVTMDWFVMSFLSAKLHNMASKDISHA